MVLLGSVCRLGTEARRLAEGLLQARGPLIPGMEVVNKKQWRWKNIEPRDQKRSSLGMAVYTCHPSKEEVASGLLGECNYRL